MKRLIPLAALSLLGWSLESAAAIQFAPAVNYPTGSTSGGPGPAPIGTVAGDVDGDGDLDTLIADPNGSGPLFLRNLGGGRFAPGVRAAAESGIGALAAADLNHDGRLDLVGTSGSEVVVLLGAGDGSFSLRERHAMPVGGQQQTIVVDANRDGHPDLVGVTQGGLQFFRGRGDGGFDPGALTPIWAVVPAVAAADFDRDGVPDLAAIDAVQQRAVVLRGMGDGRFVETGGGTVGLIAEAIVAADFNGDGFSDVATADSFSFSMSALLADGRGGFLPAARHAAGIGPVSLEVGDFDGDGDPDIAFVLVGEARVLIYENRGLGVFAEVGRLAVTSFPQTPVVADFDGDGKPDIAVAGGAGELSVLRNITP